MDSQNNLKFVRALCRFFGTEPPDEEMAELLALLESTGPYALVSHLQNQPLTMRTLSAGWFQSVLGSEPDTADLDAMELFLKEGATDEQMIATLLSGEKFQKGYGRVPRQFLGDGDSDEKMVRALHCCLLTRPAGAGEIDFCRGVLHSDGVYGLAMNLLNSYEYRLSVVQSFFMGILHRPPGGAESVRWVNTGWHVRRLRHAALLSPEFYHLASLQP